MDLSVSVPTAVSQKWIPRASQVLADERQMRVALWIARNTPLATVLGEVSVTKEDAARRGILNGQAG